MADDPGQHTVTVLLHRWKDGDQAAHDELMPLVYAHLRRLAQRSLSSERPDHTLQHTALVNEAYLELVRMDVGWNDRTHFFALAARAMRRILVDYARTRNRVKRGAGIGTVPIEEAANEPAPEPAVDMETLDEALLRLATIDARKSDMLELRYFGGLSHAELSEHLGVSLKTVNRDLEWARDWLKTELAL